FAAWRRFCDDRVEIVFRRRPRWRLDDDAARFASDVNRALLGIRQPREETLADAFLRRGVSDAAVRHAIDDHAADLVGHHRQLFEFRIAEPHRAFAAAAGGDDDLDRIDVLDLAAAARSPRERDLPLLRLDRRPVARENEIAAIEPPDI